jgi:uncharacterized protein (TIGR02453 family)
MPAARAPQARSVREAAPARKKASPRAAHFGRELFAFLRELAVNNERAWFEENRARYEAAVKQPMLRFIEDFAAPLGKIAPSYVADPRPSGGSFFRIHRDTRFSKDKSPYKTQAAAHFRHAVGKDVHAPGFYLHLEPNNVFAGFGLWHPEPEALASVRDALVRRSAEWKKAISHKTFVTSATLEGDKLVRAPKGFDPDHPMIDDIKRKDFVAVARLTERDACSTDFIDRYAEHCRAAVPFMRFLTQAMGLEW